LFVVAVTIALPDFDEYYCQGTKILTLLPLFLIDNYRLELPGENLGNASLAEQIGDSTK
jgi:hypothetical protein